ncbi:MAG: 16S rRNA (guanine(527)-N(7))-methyltransferase RsmG [Saprospiraceae bacterium]
MELILKYFPNLTDTQKAQFEQLDPLYRDWNAKINVISRKDIDNLYLHHVLHSLAIAKVIQFKSGATVLDIGTGGGFPGIPLAILFPETQFTLVDSIGKKIKVVQEISEAIGLQNITAFHQRVEDFKKPQFDFAVTRAVTTLDKLTDWSFRVIKNKQIHGLPNGLIALKGSNFQEEVKALPRDSYVEDYPISDFFKEDYFQEKFVVYVQA